MRRKTLCLLRGPRPTRACTCSLSQSERTWKGPRPGHLGLPHPGLPESPQTPLFSLISHWWNFLCYNFLQSWQLLVRSFILSNQDSERPEAAVMPTLCCCSGSRRLEPPARSLGHLWLSADRAAHHTLRRQGPPWGRPIPAPQAQEARCALVKTGSEPQLSHFLSSH